MSRSKTESQSSVTTEDKVDAKIQDKEDENTTGEQNGKASDSDGDNNTIPSPGGKVKVKHSGLKGKKITLPSGIIATFDENGILEVESDIAGYLLSISGYEKG
jgi:hypothetical protein